MQNHEMETFLAEPGHLVRIGTIDADGMPRVTPTWFVERDGMMLFTPRQASVFLANVRRDPRISLLVDEAAPPCRKVNVSGRVEIVHDLDLDDSWREVYREIAGRYIESEAVERYMQSTIDQTRALLGVRLADASVTSWRMPVAGEPATGIWARRYYAEDTHMARLADQ